MRAGFGQFQQATPEYLRFAQQYGATDILLNTPDLPSYNGTWPLHDLVNPVSYTHLTLPTILLV